MILVLFVVVAGGIIAAMALFIDFASVFVTRDQAATAAEMSAHRGLQEMYQPDYGAAFILPAGPNWSGNTREAAARNAAIAIAQMHPVGPRFNFTTYFANPQLNDGNAANGDIILGRWAKVAGGGPYGLNPVPGVIAANGDLPWSVQVTIRRTPGAAIAGVREGGNAIPYVLGIPGVSNPQGLSVTEPYIASLVPAAMVGPGPAAPYTPVSGGAAVRTGVMPLALIGRAAVLGWITANNFANPLQFDIDNSGALGAAAEGFWSDYGVSGGGGPAYFNAIDQMLNYLEALGGVQLAPPLNRLNDLGVRNNLGGANRNTLINKLNNSFLNRTWVCPVVADDRGAVPPADQLRTIGFVRVYCTAVDTVNERFTLLLAPSGNTRNVGGMNSCKRSWIQTTGAVPASLLAGGNILPLWQANFWTITDGFRVASLPYGIASATATVKTRQ